MSLDRSLKTAGSLARHRNVLTRAERLERLGDEERWEKSQSVFGLPKVINRNLKVGKKTKKQEEAATEAVVAEDKDKDKDKEKVRVKEKKEKKEKK